MLFRILDSDIFTLFSGANRHLYEEVLVRVYDTSIRTDLAFPTRSEVIGQIYGVLADHPELWREDETPVSLDEVLKQRGRRLRRRRASDADAEASTQAVIRARHIYARLLQTGWFEETQYGLKVTVDMPAGAMRLAEFLCLLREGISEELGGLVAEVKTAVEAVRLLPRENALALHKAARDAAAFGRYLRSVLSALREIDRQILASESLEQRLKHYFEDFVERVLLKDYAAISTTSHPYRFRHRILQTLHALEDSPVDVQILAAVYLEAQLVPDLAAALDLVFDDFRKIGRVFDSIEQAFGRIQQHRGRLEARLRNTVRYAGRQASAFLQRSEQVVLKLDRLLEEDVSLAIEGDLEAVRGPLAPQLLARGRGERVSAEGQPLALATPDPLWDLRRKLEQSYLDRLTVKPAQVARFLERRVPPSGETLASSFRIGDLDDFLAFETLRLAVHKVIGGVVDDAVTRLLLEHFEFVPAPEDVMDNAWLKCGGFRVKRKGAHVTLENDHVA